MADSLSLAISVLLQMASEMTTGFWPPSCSPIWCPRPGWSRSWVTAAGESCSTHTTYSPASSYRVSEVDSWTERVTDCSRHSTGPARAVRCAATICEEVHRLGLDARAGVHAGEI